MTNETTPAEVRSNDGLCMLDDDEADPVRLWAEIHRLRAAVQGPGGFATWQDAAVAERVRRVLAERAIADLQMPEKADKSGLLRRFNAWRERTGFFMDHPDGGM